MNSCEHKYIYKGVAFKKAYPIAGSSASMIYYYDSFFCEKCLEVVNKKLDFSHSSYDSIKFGATPLEN